jgi:hypothetical protein
MKKIIAILFFGSFLAAEYLPAATLTSAPLTGSDFSGWTNGTDVTRWYVSTTPGTKAVVADSTQNGRESIGANAFFIRGAATGGYVDAFFKLGGGLEVGQSVAFDFVYSWGAGTRGIEFNSGSDKVSFTHGGNNALNFVNLAGTSSAIYDEGFNSAFRIKATATASNQLTLETTNFSNPSYLNSQVVTLNVATFNEIKFYTGGISEANDNFGLFMNNFTVIPEPSAFTLIALGSCSLLALRRRQA